MIAFLDLTALAALYAGGPGAKEVKAALMDEESLAMAMISKVHMAALLDDLLEEGAPHASIQEIGCRFLSDEPQFIKVSTDGVVMEAMVMAVRHHLEGDQAVQLAAALTLERQILRQAPSLPQPVSFVTLDPLLAAAAEAEGLRVVPRQGV